MIRVNITFTGWADIRMTKRKIVPIINDGLAAALAWWHKNTLAKHFETSAYQKYRIGKRKDVRVNRRGEKIPYEQFKQRRHKLAGPMRFSGDLQRQVSGGYTIKATKRKPIVKLQMKGPEYLRPAGRPARSSHGGMMPDMGGELTRVTSHEAANMSRMAVKKIIQGMKALKGRRRVAAGQAV